MEIFQEKQLITIDKEALVFWDISTALKLLTITLSDNEINKVNF